MTAPAGNPDESVSVPVVAGEAELTLLPSARGVLILRSADDRPIVITSTANLRDAARRRLASGAEGRSIDYRAITARIEAVPVRSRFECECRELEVARTLMPATYRHLFDRRQTWFITIDPESEPPTIGRAPTHMLDEISAASPGVRLLGPIRDKHKANRAVEQIVDMLDLCRYPRELARAPQGTPCVYKEMGRCPAACDGSEPMTAYRDRLLSVMTIIEDPASWRDSMSEAMSQAAGAHDFEAAAGIRRRIETADALLGDRARAWMTDLASLRVAVLVNIGSTDTVGLLAAGPGGVTSIGEVALDAPPSDALLERLAEAPVGPTPVPLSRDAADQLALLCTWLYGTHRDTRFIPIAEADARHIQSAAGQVVASAGETDSPEDDDRADTFVDV